MLPLVLSLLVVFESARAAPPGKPRAEPEAAALLTAIAPDFAIVTEVGTLAPYAGQQVSVLYWLRARRAPAAVDVDPQQFPGFWAEVVAISADSGLIARTSGGYSEYLLRQVAAFPLNGGPAQLPPLSIKIRRAAWRPAGGAQWDVKARSESVTLRVRALPSGPRPPAMVGEVRAALSARLAGAGRGAILELEGTANLGLFRPEDWWTLPPGVRLRSRLLAWDRRAQILDTGGRRRLTLRMRQRWSLECDPGVAGELRLPVFEPQDGSWSEVRIPWPAPPAPAPQTAADGRPMRAAGRRTDWRPVLLAGAAALSAVLLGLRHAGRWRRGAPGGAVDVAALERAMHRSPHAFLDAARRALVRQAQRRMRRHDLGERDTLLDECWRSIERYRFAGAPPPLEAQIELLARLRAALRSPDRIIAGPEREAPE